MKIRTLVGLSFICSLLVYCKTDISSDKTPNLIESHPSFFELHDGSWIANRWIRKPENLLMIHETFIALGYKTLLADEMSSNPIIIGGIYINKNGSDLLDSLELSYDNQDIKNKYYREFWKRRKTEKNAELVIKIIREIKQELQNIEIVKRIPNSAVNDTLLRLLNIEFTKKEDLQKSAIQNFKDLKKLGFHKSAYNLLYQRSAYTKVNWNRDSLEKQLTKSDELCEAWFQDNEP